MTSMPRPARSGQNPDDAPREEVVLGVDTHKDLHVAAVITGIGGLLGSQSFPATAAGYRQLLDWARGFGPVNRAGVEGTGTYGAALARHLRQAGVAWRGQPARKATRRRRGKTDTIDAEAAARAVLSGPGQRRAQVRRRQRRGDKGLQDGPGLRGQVPHPGDQPAQGHIWSPRTRRCASRWPACQPRPSSAACASLADPPGASDSPRPRPSHTPSARPAHPAAQRRERATSTAPHHRCPHRLRLQLLTPTASVPTAPPRWSSPPATTPNGSAAKHPSPRSAASAPIQASSGKTQRHRLNRGGDRQANAASAPHRDQPPALGSPTPATTSNAARQKARPAAKPSAASSATSPARSTASSSQPSALTCPKPLDKHRASSART